MAISNGEIIEANELMNSFGANFNDTAQMIFNADYIGFNSKLFNTTTPNLKDVFYSTFKSNDANEVGGFFYDSTNDLYETPDLSGYYVIIEASSFGTWGNSNNTIISQLSSGKWIISCTTGTAEVRRAQVIKSLFFGTNATDQLVLDFSSITAIKSSDARDVDKRGHYATAGIIGDTAGGVATYTGTFVDTSTNTDCSSWSFVDTFSVFSNYARWELPGGTVLHSVGTGVGSSDELGTDTSADEANNPADCQIDLSNITGSGDASGKAIILCSGDITWVASNTTSDSNIDFFTDHSIPDFTLAVDSEVLTSTLIFKDTASASTDNMITAINSTIDATSSEQISVSANGGSNWTDVNNANIARPIAGTAIWRKIVITRTDLSKLDLVTEQAVKHSFY